MEEKGAEVDERDSFGDTPLHHACKSSRNFKICQWLIGDKEANVNSQNHTGATPLSTSSQQYGLELFKWLVDQKMSSFLDQYSNIDALLQYICGFNSHEAVKWLVEEKGANIDSKNPDGSTPLHIAVDKMHLRTVIYLLESGSDCTIKSKYGEFPLQIEQEDWCDFYQKLLDERVIENMPLIVMDVLPEEWYSASNKVFLLTQLVATPAFVQISTNAEVTGELMDFHTGMSYQVAI